MIDDSLSTKCPAVFIERQGIFVVANEQTIAFLQGQF
jgi:hypothetical protein